MPARRDRAVKPVGQQKGVQAAGTQLAEDRGRGRLPIQVLRLRVPYTGEVDDLVLAHRRAGCGPAVAGLHVVEEDPRAGRRGDRRVDQGMRNRRPLQIFSQDEALSSTSGFA